jgi:hypothetical protein
MTFSAGSLHRKQPKVYFGSSSVHHRPASAHGQNEFTSMSILSHQQQVRAFSMIYHTLC